MARSKALNPAYPLSFLDAEKLVDGLFEWRKYRHSAYVRLAVDLGLRYAETSRITWGDILDNRIGEIKMIEKKTSKTVERTIEKETKEHIEKCWLSCGKPAMGELILRSRGLTGRVSCQSLNMTAKNRWLELYELRIRPENFSQHSFRKTSAMRIYEKYGLVQAKFWLNHERVDMTEKYLLLSAHEVKKMGVH